MPPTQLRPTGRGMPRPYILLPTLPIPHPTHHVLRTFRITHGSRLTVHKLLSNILYISNMIFCSVQLFREQFNFLVI